MTRYRCAYAWIGDRVASDVIVDVAEGRIIAVVPVTSELPTDALAGAVPLPGLTLPGLANVHSHAFHRVLRGRTQRRRGTFWGWREQMYAVAERLDPDRYYAVARATFAEMALAGVTCVGEFHYLHHAPGGHRYTDPNAMGAALRAAAAAAGVRLTLLDACYLAGDVDGRPPEGVQRRFADGSASAWAERVALLRDDPGCRIGAAVHSVRAVPAEALPVVAAYAGEADLPLHLHLSEQRQENTACADVHGCSPTRLVAEAGVLGPTTTAVHATHLTDGDVALLAGSRTVVCLCPTTERDLADGIGPAGRLAGAGTALTLGSDSQAVVDLFEEARAVEMHERLLTGSRGHWSSDALLRAATAHGHAALGWADAGALAPGMRADLVTVALHSTRLAGAHDATTVLDAVVFGATAADVVHVVCDGREVVREGRHLLVEDVPAALDDAVSAVLA